MAHWSNKYVGKKYIPDQYDCTSLVQEVLLNERGVTIDLPTDKPKDPFARSRMIDHYKEAYAEPTNDPKDGDIVLMRLRNRLNHIGVFCTINNKRYVLHNLKNTGNVVLHKFTDLGMWSIKVDSFYQLKESPEL